MSVPPLFLDIDGTITREAGGLAAEIIEPLRAWPAPIVLATGKAFPYPVALCHYFAIPQRVVAENGGIICVDDHLEYLIDTDRLDAFTEAATSSGIDFGWDVTDTINRWRETEIAVERSAHTRAELEALADEHGLEVIDSGYAYHIKDPAISKGAALETVCRLLDIEPDDAVAIGDSENDVSTFELVGRSIALANADDAAKAAADEVFETGYASGTLQVLADLRDS